MEKAALKIRGFLGRIAYHYRAEAVHESVFGRIIVEAVRSKKDTVRYHVFFKTDDGRRTFSRLDECRAEQAVSTICAEISRIIADIRKNMRFMRGTGFQMVQYGVFRSGAFEAVVYKRHEYGRRTISKISCKISAGGEERSAETNKTHFKETLRKGLPDEWKMLLGSRTRDWLLTKNPF